MTDLSAFLLARIAEDEAAAQGAGYSIDDHWWLPDYAAIDRVLAECDAKRRIVEIHGAGEHLCPSAEAVEDGLWSVTDQDVMAPCPTLRLLALPYADRPGYREEWKP